MKTTTTKTRSLIALVTGICISLATVVAASAQSCYLATQLEDPQLRAEYEQKVAEAKVAARSPYRARYNYSVSFTPAAGENMTIDSFSYDCMLCHDGLNAKYHDVRYRSDKRNGGTSLTTVLGSHPIGMPYGAMAYSNKKLQSLKSVDASLVLVDGRVGCLSCHNLLNPASKHLSVDNENSQLCMQCHTK